VLLGCAYHCVLGSTGVPIHRVVHLGVSNVPELWGRISHIDPQSTDIKFERSLLVANKDTLSGKSTGRAILAATATEHGTRHGTRHMTIPNRARPYQNGLKNVRCHPRRRYPRAGSVEDGLPHSNQKSRQPASGSARRWLLDFSPRRTDERTVRSLEYVRSGEGCVRSFCIDVSI
jgi:hypothetical protein